MPSSAAERETYPNRPIRLIVPFAPGNQLDVFARLVGSRMADSMGQPVIVENRPGVAGNAASEVVAKSAPDGYTLLVSGVLITLLPLTYGPLAVDPVKAFAPVTRLAQQPIVIAANASLNVDSLADLIVLARSAPGTIAYATSGVGTAQHVAMTMLAQRAGITLLHVPYTNSGQLIADVLSGVVPVAMSFPGTVEPHRKVGRAACVGVARCSHCRGIRFSGFRCTVLGRSPGARRDAAGCRRPPARRNRTHPRHSRGARDVYRPERGARG
jgi:tripartite-type tricarboxylate transporter receptor subunit TctC